MVPLAARQAPKSVPATLLLYTNLGILTNLSPLGSKMTHVRQCGTPSCVPATAALSCALLRPEAQPCHFFFLWYGRSRSKARSLHEKKLLVRKLLWTQVVTCSLANQNNQKHKARRRSPGQICVSPSEGQQSKQRTGQEPNKKNHKRFAETQWKKPTVSQ